MCADGKDMLRMGCCRHVAGAAPGAEVVAAAVTEGAEVGADAVTEGAEVVAEAGAGFGGFTATPRILKIDVNGTISILTDRYLSGPITDLVYHQGKLYVANKGKISTVNPSNGAVVDIISAIPAGGDHATNQIAFGPDGRIYFAQGSATNSGVVGLDNFSPNLGWPYSFPFVHDVPAKDVKLIGQNFEAPNMLADGQKNITVIKGYEAKVTLPIKNKNADINNDKGTGAISGNLIGNATTGAFTAFGNKTTQGQIIKGDVKCNGCILSAKPDGTDLRVAAWGMRLDTFTGLAFDKKGHLLVTDPGAEERGSRPIKNDHDKIWSIDMSSNNNNNNSTVNNNNNSTTVSQASQEIVNKNHFNGGGGVLLDNDKLRMRFYRPPYSSALAGLAAHNNNNNNSSSRDYEDDGPLSLVVTPKKKRHKVRELLLISNSFLYLFFIFLSIPLSLFLLLPSLTCMILRVSTLFS